VLLARIHRHSQFTRPDEPPLPSCASGCRCSAWGSRHQQSGFQRVRAHPESRACCTVGRSSQCSRIAPYHVSRSLCIAFFHYPLLYPNPVAPIRRSRRPRLQTSFSIVSSTSAAALPNRGCRVSHVSNNEAGRTAYLSKAQDVGDHLHRRSWTATEIDLRIHMVSQPLHPCGRPGDTRSLPGSTWIHTHFRAST
jgi:hypothetical protein